MAHYPRPRQTTPSIPSPTLGALRPQEPRGESDRERQSDREHSVPQQDCYNHDTPSQLVGTYPGARYTLSGDVEKRLVDTNSRCQGALT